MAFPFGTGFTNHNDESVGGGVGGSILVPIVPKVLEAYFSGMTGRGIGRYGASQLPDVTFNANGSLAPIQETMLLAGAIWHAFPGLNFYGYAGEEHQSPSLASHRLGRPIIGFGNPFFNNSGCDIELSTVCNNNVKLVRQIRAASGPTSTRVLGRLAGGLQYILTQKYGFQGIGGTGAGRKHLLHQPSLLSVLNEGRQPLWLIGPLAERPAGRPCY